MDYYVDNSGGDGTGTFLNPWNNIGGHVDDLAAGDIMYVRGNVFAPNRIYNEAGIDIDSGVCASGTPGNPITIQSYNDEFVTLQSSIAGYIINFDGVDYWIVDGFELDKQGVGGVGFGFTNADHDVVRNCEIHDGAFEAVQLISGADNTIEECVIYNMNAGPGVDAHGIMVEGATGTLVQNCTIYDIRGSCVQCWDTGANWDTIIQDNYLYVNAAVERCCEGAVSIKRGNPIIRRNVMHGWRVPDGTCGGTGGGIGGACIVYMLADSAVFEDNIIYDCTSGLTVSSTDNDVQIRRNLFYDLVTDPLSWCNTALYIHHQAAGTVYVYNNTFHNCPEYLWYIGDQADVEFKNNLASDTGDIHEDPGAVIAADYNGWYNVADSIVGLNDTVGVDPRFEDEATDNYRIRRNSTAVNAGMDVGLSFVGSAPDLGAYEHRRFVMATIV